MPEASHAAWVDHAATVLATAGYRSGGARRAVIELLAGQGCALSALEIEGQLAGTSRRVARASVYRVLEELAALRLVTRVEVGQGVVRFERAHPGHHHHHAVCENCGEIEPFGDDELEAVIQRVAARLNFDVGEHDITLHGACARCRAEPGRWTD